MGGVPRESLPWLAILSTMDQSFPACRLLLGAFMAPSRRSRFWSRLFQNFLPPWTPGEAAALMCHASGKLIGRRGMLDRENAQRRWLNRIAAAMAAVGLLFLLSRLASAEAPSRTGHPAVAVQL